MTKLLDLLSASSVRLEDKQVGLLPYTLTPQRSWHTFIIYPVIAGSPLPTVRASAEHRTFYFKLPVHAVPCTCYMYSTHCHLLLLVTVVKLVFVQAIYGIYAVGSSFSLSMVCCCPQMYMWRGLCHLKLGDKVRLHNVLTAWSEDPDTETHNMLNNHLTLMLICR